LIIILGGTNKFEGDLGTEGGLGGRTISSIDLRSNDIAIENFAGKERSQKRDTKKKNGGGGRDSTKKGKTKKVFTFRVKNVTNCPYLRQIRIARRSGHLINLKEPWGL